MGESCFTAGGLTTSPHKGMLKNASNPKKLTPESNETTSPLVVDRKVYIYRLIVDNQKLYTNVRCILEV